MSGDPTATNPAAAPLLARAAAAGARDAERVAAAVADLSLADADRLDERTRLAVHALFAAMVSAVERELGMHAARVLGGGQFAQMLARTSDNTVARLSRSGALRDAALVAELVARVRQDQIAEALPRAPADDRPSLLARLLSCPDQMVAEAARTLLIAENRRRGVLAGTELPAELHHRLVWLVAAALRERLLRENAQVSDDALVIAAEQCLAAHDEGERAEAAALRLVAAIDPRANELPDLLVDALGDGRLILFTAALARAGALDYDMARAIVLDPAGDRLWLLLRSHRLSREMIARIGFALGEADAERDSNALPDTLDLIVTIAPTTAHAALASARCNAHLRAAMRALDGSA